MVMTVVPEKNHCLGRFDWVKTSQAFAEANWTATFLFVVFLSCISATRPLTFCLSVCFTQRKCRAIVHDERRSIFSLLCLCLIHIKMISFIMHVGEIARLCNGNVSAWLPSVCNWICNAPPSAWQAHKTVPVINHLESLDQLSISELVWYQFSLSPSQAFQGQRRLHFCKDDQLFDTDLIPSHFSCFCNRNQIKDT